MPLWSPAIPLLWQSVIHLHQLQATSAGMMYFVHRKLLLLMPLWLIVFCFSIYSNLTWQLGVVPRRDEPLAPLETQPQTIRHLRHRWYRVWMPMCMQHGRIKGNRLLWTSAAATFFFCIVSLFSETISGSRWIASKRQIWDQLQKSIKNGVLVLIVAHAWISIGMTANKKKGSRKRHKGAGGRMGEGEVHLGENDGRLIQISEAQVRGLFNSKTNILSLCLQSPLVP